MPNRADTFLFYGDTGAGKTAQLGELAEWEFHRTGKRTRLISADMGGWDSISHLIQTPANPKGIIEAWDIQYVKNPFSVITSLSKGKWPLLDEGKIVMKSGELENIGQYMIEGLTSIGELLLATHSRNQTKLSQDVSYQYSESGLEEVDGVEKEVKTTFGHAAMSHYGDVQERVLLDFIPAFATLPVSRVIWTGHEGRGDDKVTNIKGSLLGPIVVGGASVGKIVRKFGVTFHLAKAITPRGVERRAYFIDHPDDELTKKLWPTNARIPLSELTNLTKRFPGGFVPLTPEKGLGEFFDFKYGEKGKK